MKDKLGEYGLVPPNIAGKESMDHSEFSSYHNHDTKSENCNFEDLEEIREELVDLKAIKILEQSGSIRTVSAELSTSYN